MTPVSTGPADYAHFGRRGVSATDPHFANDWQVEHPGGTLGGFVDYLDAYQGAGGELATSVELTEDVAGVRLMTVYQAKGLEFRYARPFRPVTPTRTRSVASWPSGSGRASS